MNLDEALQHYREVCLSSNDTNTLQEYDQLVRWLEELKQWRLDAAKRCDVKLYLDDDRSTPEGWVRVYGIEQAKIILRSRRVSHLSVDNDLGNLDPKTEGFNLLDWLERVVHEDSTFPVPVITVHSANAGRAPSMRQTATKLELIRQQQIAGS